MTVGPTEHAGPFDAAADAYDAEFTHTPIGRLMREAVWNRLDSLFPAGSVVLELNCGTGEDAVHLACRRVHVVATDLSPRMIDITRAKSKREGVESYVDARVLAMDDLAELTHDCPRFDGAFSNFGGLNCVSDRASIARSLADLLKPGARVALCVMGPWCCWEWIWFLSRWEPRKAFRRLRRGGARWKGIAIQYPHWRTLAREFRPYFRMCRVSAVGAFVPSSYAGEWVTRHPGLFASLVKGETRFAHRRGAVALADHYLIELERVDFRDRLP